MTHALRTLALSSLVLLAAPALAEPWDKVLTRGNGVLTENHVPLPDYHSVVVKAPLDVEIAEGPSDGARVIIDSNLADRVRAEVDQGVLTINMVGRNVDLHKKSRILLRTPSLKSLQLGGSADVVVLPRKQKISKLELKLDGSGDLEWRGGAADELVVAAGGSGDVELKSRAKNATLSSDGSGELKVQLDVNGSLRLKMGGSGDVELRGSISELTVESSGSGQLELEGNTSRLSVKLGGSGELDAEKMIARAVSLESTGSGDAKVTVRNGPLTAKANGSGDISWRGEATDVQVQAKGSGQVKQVGE